MLATTPTSDYVSLRNHSRRDLSISPSCRASFNIRTPPRLSAAPSSYRSPLLTPSPLKRQAAPCPEPMDADDVFSSPMPSSYALLPPKERSTRPRSRVLLDADDEDDGLFLAPSSSHSLFPPTSSPMPLRTPVKQSHQTRKTPERTAFSVKHLNNPSTAGLTAGTKRKPTPAVFTTPSRKRTLTPLTVTASAALEDGESSALGFDRLAPLPAPRFTARTPHTKAETELHLKRQADSMTKLRIHDLDQSGDESGYDSGPEVQGNVDGGKRLLFGSVPPSTVKGKTKTKLPPLPSSRLQILIKEGQVNNEEVAEAISPGGHIIKRRARSRPVSAELLETVNNTPMVDSVARGTADVNSPSSVAFPSTNAFRMRRTSASSSSSSEAGSPRPRLRMTSPRLRIHSQSTQRLPLSRLSSMSSATLFFGPAIPQPDEHANNNISSLASSMSPRAGANSHADTPIAPSFSAHPIPTNRHSYAGPSSTTSPWPWVGAGTPSPGESIPRGSDDEEVDFFFGGPADSSFAFSLTGETPSPKKKQRTESAEMLPKKFRPRDSGVVLDESDDDGARLSGDFSGVPRASTSVSTIHSESDGEALVTPGFGPGAASGWPSVGIVSLDDEPFVGGGMNVGNGLGMDRSVDAFIMRTLTAGSKPSKSSRELKRVPGTPVKKIKTSHITIDRPWQSAVAHKIGFPEFDEAQQKGKSGKGKPRKSLPAAFPGSGLGKTERPRRDALNFGVGMDTEVEGDDEEGSPTLRKDGSRYDGLGLGRPPVPAFPRNGSGGKGSMKPNWLMRRSSSGAFSSGSETASSQSATPTRATPKADWNLPPSFLPVSLQSTSSSSTSSTTSTTLNSPTVAAVSRHLPIASQHARGHSHSGSITISSPKKASTGSLFAQPHHHHVHHHSAHTPFPAGFLRTRRSMAFGEEQMGRFEHDFVEIDELGRGEFGRVMKARYKQGSQEVFAVKKSKRFEGQKHRLRLREEVDILKHLSQVAGANGYGTQVQSRSQAHPAALGRHPNVLGYIHSWEEDETLFIQTELCELGNFAHFLGEYGKSFPRLDEARVWKIFAELSSGMSFIHDAGVIHLDLKPANIFVTGEGRFKIGDFGMASIWPRPLPAGEPGNGAVGSALSSGQSGFEREGDKLYLAPEVLQGKYGKAADIFSLGMTMLETATNIVVPDQGESWHRLRHEDYAQVDFEGISSELVELLKSMMRSEPALRIDAGLVCAHPVVTRARRAMEKARTELGAVFGASALAGAPQGWLDEVLGRTASRHEQMWEDDDWDDVGEPMDIGL